MGNVTFQGDCVSVMGDFLSKGAVAPDFKLATADLADVGLGAFEGKKKVLSIVPSLDTPVCALSAKTFNAKAASMNDVVVLNISADLPFAAGRFCAAEGIEDVVPLSCFRSNFGGDYGVKISDGPLAGLLARAVIVLDEHNTVLYSELVPEITNEPDYDAALAALV